MTKNKGMKMMLCTDDACDFLATSVYHLAQHARKEHKDKFPFKCPTCTRGYGSSGNLLYHMKVHGPLRSGVTRIENSENNDRFKCINCAFSTDGQSKLTRHYRMHHKDVKPYKCPICREGYKQSHGLKYHRQHKHDKESTRNGNCVKKSNDNLVELNNIDLPKETPIENQLPAVKVEYRATSCENIFPITYIGSNSIYSEVSAIENSLPVAYIDLPIQYNADVHSGNQQTISYIGYCPATFTENSEFFSQETLITEREDETHETLTHAYTTAEGIKNTVTVAYVVPAEIYKNSVNSTNTVTEDLPFIQEAWSL